MLKVMHINAANHAASSNKRLRFHVPSTKSALMAVVG